MRDTAAAPIATVFLVDDDASVRRALTRLITSAGYQIQTFSSASAFLASNWRSCHPACLVLDIRLPDVSGMQLQSELQNDRAVLPIIFITGHGDIPMSVRAIKDGAVDFLPKPVKDTELFRAIEQALGRAIRDQAERDKLEAIQSRVKTLTPREHQVMSLITRGLLNKQVAFELGTAEKTIKVHRARVMEKMGVGSLAELVRVAEFAGLGE